LDSKDDEINRMQIKLANLLEEVNRIKLVKQNFTLFLIYKEYEKQKLVATTNDNLIKNLKSTNNTNSLKEIIERLEKTKQEELHQIEQRYQNMLIEKDVQHKEFLEEIDQLMLEQENEINEIKQKNDELVLQLRQVQEENTELHNILESQRDENENRKIPEGSESTDKAEDLMVYY
jgi:hypothetical protein